MRQEAKQNVDEAETLCSIRNVLIFDEDIEDLARHAESDYLEKPVPKADMDRIIKCCFGNLLTK